MVKSKYKPAFTIVELLVVVVVIGILASLVIVSYTGISKKATEAALQADLSNIAKQFALYRVENDTYPTGIDGNNCPIPADTRYCFKLSNGNALGTYSGNASSFSLNASNGTIVYRVTNDKEPSLYAVPTAPQTLTTTANSSTQITLNWTAPVSDSGHAITQYIIYRSTSSDTETQVATTGNVLNYTDSSLSATTQYYYKIKATNSAGDSDFSNEANATTLVNGGIDSYTKLVLHGETLTDSNTVPKSVTNSGVTVSSVQKKFGTDSLRFNGSSYLQIPYSTDFELNNSGSPKDFAIDFWIYNAGGNTNVGIMGGAPFNEWTDFPTIDIFQDYTSNSGKMAVQFVDSMVVYVLTLGSPYSLGQNSWKHFAATRQSGVLRYFIDGVLLVTDSAHTTAKGRIGGSQGLIIGRRSSPTNPYYLNGYIDELRISVGTARWTSNFSVPTQAYYN